MIKSPKIQSKPLSKTATCPTCDKPSEIDYRPFCSKRCADVDLNQWLNEGYKIPQTPEIDLED